MRGMFSWCKSLQILDLSHFNTKNVTDMKEMFFLCSSLTVLNLSKFNFKKVTNMKEMFFECLSLNKIILSVCDSDNINDGYDILIIKNNLIEFYGNNLEEIQKINHPILNCYMNYLKCLETKKEDSIKSSNRFRNNGINFYYYGY